MYYHLIGAVLTLIALAGCCKHRHQTPPCPQPPFAGSATAPPPAVLPPTAEPFLPAPRNPS